MANHAQGKRKTVDAPPAQRARTRAADGRTHALAETGRRLNAGPAAQAVQRVAGQIAGKGVVQRSVLHKIVDGKTVYYSDLERGKRHYDDKSEAEKVDKELSEKPEVIKNALRNSRGRERRVPTPYSYAGSLSAAPSSRNQGPHTVGFAATENRLQQRLEKGDLDEVKNQVLSPYEFELTLGLLGSHIGIEGKKAERMKLDYQSLHDEYSSLLGNDKQAKTSGSRFHLVTRKLMQMHPATTYGKNVKSKGNGERAKSRFGTHSLDDKAKKGFPKEKRKHLEEYYDMREDIFHSTDEETDREDFEPYKYTLITPRTKEQRRNRRKPRIVAPKIVPTVSKLDDKPSKKLKKNPD